MSNHPQISRSARIGVPFTAALQVGTILPAAQPVLATFKQHQKNPETPDRLRFAQLGVAGVLPKPFDPMTLSDQVEELLSQTAGALEKQ